MPFTITITLIIVVITVVVSYLCFNNPQLKNRLVHHPYSVERGKEYYRWITSGLVHRDWIHLGINMFVFFQFGSFLEKQFTSADYFGSALGPFVFLVFYIIAIIVSDIPFFNKHKDNPYMSSAGASGAVSAILFAYMLFLPWKNIYLFGIIPIPSIIAGVLYLIYESRAHQNKGTSGGINHLAHIFGALFGIVGTIAIKPDMIPTYIHNLTNIPYFQ